MENINHMEMMSPDIMPSSNQRLKERQVKDGFQKIETPEVVFLSNTKKKQIVLLISGEAKLDTMTGGPVRRLIFWLAARTPWPGMGPAKATTEPSQLGTPALRIIWGLGCGLCMGDRGRFLSLFISSMGTV